VKIVGIGVDIVEIARFQAAIDRQGERLLERLFTAAEREYCAGMKITAPFYAARFAAKEAVSKAFGTGIGAELGWKDIEICRRESGCPYVVLSGSGLLLAKKMRVAEVLLSLSHSEHYAVAQAIAVTAS
jgi:holo-[acyl-carrier protein] synthase